MPSSSSPDARPALWPVACAFVVFGIFWGGWAVAAADVERDLGLTHTEFGLLFSVGLVGGAVSNALGGPLSERHGTGRVLAVAIAAWSCVLLVGAALPPVFPFAAALVAVIGLAGLVDVVMNVAAAAELADRPGALVRFHAFFNVGAAIGAGGTGLLLGHGASWRVAWLVVAALMVPVAIACSRSALPAGGSGDHVSLLSAPGLLKRERLLLVAIAFAVGAVVEGGIELWGVLFLRRQLASGLLVGAGSAVFAYAIATVARVVFGPVAGRRGATAGLVAGCATAAGGLLVLTAAPTAAVAAVGLVLAAGGISMSWPLLLAHATAGHPRPGLVVGAVSAVGYTGFVFGPTVIGGLAGAVGLRGGLLLLTIGAVFVAASPFLSRRPADIAADMAADVAAAAEVPVADGAE